MSLICCVYVKEDTHLTIQSTSKDYIMDMLKKKKEVFNLI